MLQANKTHKDVVSHPNFGIPLVSALEKTRVVIASNTTKTLARSGEHGNSSIEKGPFTKSNFRSSSIAYQAVPDTGSGDGCVAKRSIFQGSSLRCTCLWSSIDVDGESLVAKVILRNGMIIESSWQNKSRR